MHNQLYARAPNVATQKPLLTTNHSVSKQSAMHGALYSVHRRSEGQHNRLATSLPSVNAWRWANHFPVGVGCTRNALPFTLSITASCSSHSSQPNLSMATSNYLSLRGTWSLLQVNPFPPPPPHHHHHFEPCFLLWCFSLNHLILDGMCHHCTLVKY